MKTAEEEARHAHWSVWQIVDDMDRRLEETGGEVTPDVAALEALSEEEARYAIAQWIAAHREYGSRQKQAKAMADEYDSRAARFGDLKQKCKERIGELLVLLDERKASTPFGSAHFQKGRVSVEVTPEAIPQLLAAGLATVKTTPDKAAIGARLKDGEEIVGCTLVEGEEVLVIR